MHEKLLAIQSELRAPKSQTNAFGKYKYRSCEDILEAVKPLLKEHGLALTLSDRIVTVGNRNYVEATARLYDPSEKQMFQTSEGSVSAGLMGAGSIVPAAPAQGMCVVTAYAREEETKKGMDGSQITGAASSYARKYALNGLFLIDDAKDSDATNDHGKEASTKPEHYPAAPTSTEEDEINL